MSSWKSFSPGELASSLTIRATVALLEPSVYLPVSALGQWGDEAGDQRRGEHEAREYIHLVPLCQVAWTDSHFQGV